jgi:hypothetical protein
MPGLEISIITAKFKTKAEEPQISRFFSKLLDGSLFRSGAKRNHREPICFVPYLYRARNLVERFFNPTKQCRRIATQCDRLAANYLAFIQLASIRLWLRVNESAPWCDRALGRQT